jgi:hypothetical protein
MMAIHETSFEVNGRHLHQIEPRHLGQGFISILASASAHPRPLFGFVFDFGFAFDVLSGVVQVNREGSWSRYSAVFRRYFSCGFPDPASDGP